jgi:hypothetical protein
MVAPKAKTI